MSKIIGDKNTHSNNNNNNNNINDNNLYSYFVHVYKFTTCYNTDNNKSINIYYESQHF